MDDYFAILTADEKRIFSTIAEYAFSLGYKARRDKTSAIGYSFIHSQVKKQIVRFTSSQNKPILRIKYFASPDYSPFFHEAIRATIEEYDFRYTGCYGCGDCDGTQGYWYQYPDGKEYYRCGKELIELFDTSELPLDGLLDLLQSQHEFFISSLTGKKAVPAG